ncbi:MAG: hypothetical protein ACOZAJ_01380, partial [Patescibacteria group bacterium]
IEHKAIQQILDNPKKFGFDGDLNNTKAVRDFANTLAHQTAVEQGYVTPEGELRLKASANGEEVRFVMGPDGKAHYEFSEGLDSQDVYQHIPTPKAVEIEPIKTETLDWWQSDYKQGTLTPLEVPSGNQNGLQAYEFLGQDGTKGTLLIDSQSHEILHSIDATDYGDDYAGQIESSYEIFNQTIDKVDKAIGEAGQSWRAADKLLAAEWSAGHTGLDKTDIVTALQNSDSSRLTELAEHVGSKAPQYLRDTDFGSYLSAKTNLADLTPAKADRLWEMGQTIKDNGFKSVDYRFVDKMFYGDNKDLGWTVKGDKFISDVKTPLLSDNRPVELNIVDKSNFNENFYLTNKQIASRIAVNEQVVLSKLSADFSQEEARQIMAMDVKDFKLSSLENHFGKGFLMFNNNSTIENWFHDVEPKLQGANAGTVGENLHKYFVDQKGVLASWHFKGDNVQAVEQTVTASGNSSQTETTLQTKTSLEEAKTALNQEATVKESVSELSTAGKTVEAITPHTTEVDVNGLKVTLVVDANGNLRQNFEGLIKGINSEQVKQTILSDDYESTIIKSVESGDINNRIDAIKEVATQLYGKIEIHKALLEKGYIEDAARFAETINKEVGLGEKLYGQGVFDKEKIAQQLADNGKTAQTVSAAKEAIRQAEELEARLKAQDAIEKAEKLLKEK